MSEHKFTPGPWQVDEFYCYGCVNAGQRHIAMANFFNACDDANRVTRENQLANARLIAAAPDMFTVLNRALAALERADDYGVPGLCALIEDISVVIAKAEGNTP